MKNKSVGIAIALLASSMAVLLLLKDTASDARGTSEAETRTSLKTIRSSTSASSGASLDSRATFGQGMQAGKAGDTEPDPLVELTRSLPTQPMPRENQSWLSFEFDTWSYICARRRLTGEISEKVQNLLEEDGLPEDTRKRYERFVTNTEEIEESLGPKVVCTLL